MKKSIFKNSQEIKEAKEKFVTVRNKLWREVVVSLYQAKSMENKKEWEIIKVIEEVKEEIVVPEVTIEKPVVKKATKKKSTKSK